MQKLDSGQWRLETLALHGDPALGPVAGAQAVPIEQTAAFDLPSADAAAARFSLEDPGPIYTRLGNPTVDAFERRAASLEGGIGALATASGQAATFYALGALAEPGANIVSSSSLYGGIYSLLQNLVPRFGVETRFVRCADTAAWESAVDDRTLCLYVETIGNPLLDTPNIERLSALAHSVGIPLIVDNTLATPPLCRPFEHGAHVVVYSATKYICGHGTTIGGIVVDSGKYDWSAGRFRRLCLPDSAYSGRVFTESFGQLAYLAHLRAHWLRDVGACMAPMTAWNLVQGMETLPLRMDRHSSNGRQVADWLAARPDVEHVLYPLRPDHATYDCARRYLSQGGGMVGAYLKGGFSAARSLVDSTRLFSLAANMGDCKSLIIHPASTTHSPVSAEVRRRIGLDDNFVRISVGLEHIDDLLADLDQALEER